MLVTKRPSNRRRWISSTTQGLSSLQTLPYTPHLPFNSGGGEASTPPKPEGAGASLNLLEEMTSFSTVALRKLSGLDSAPVNFVGPNLWFSKYIFSDLKAKAVRFTGRSDLIILSRNIAGKLNLGITLTSYSKTALEDLTENQSNIGHIRHNILFCSLEVADLRIHEMKGKMFFALGQQGDAKIR